MINTVAGAIGIQRALEWAEMAAEPGIGAVAWGKDLRAEPLPGSFPKSILYQLAKGDQQAVNPGMSALIREGSLANQSVSTATISRSPVIPQFRRTPTCSRRSRPAPTDGPNDFARCAGAIGGVFRLAWRDHDPSHADAVLRGAAARPLARDAELHSVTSVLLRSDHESVLFVKGSGRMASKNRRRQRQRRRRPLDVTYVVES